jgi:hypothetical protein
LDYNFAAINCNTLAPSSKRKNDVILLNFNTRKLLKPKEGRKEGRKMMKMKKEKT